MCTYLDIWFILLLQCFFQSMTPDDGSEADSSTFQTLCGVTPSVGWTVDTEKTENVFLFSRNQHPNVKFTLDKRMQYLVKTDSLWQNNGLQGSNVIYEKIKDSRKSISLVIKCYRELTEKLFLLFYIQY